MVPRPHHGPRGHLAFAPRLDPGAFRCAFVCAGGWGSFAQRIGRGRHIAEIEIRHGTLWLDSLAVTSGGGPRPTRVQARIGKRRLLADLAVDDRRLLITFTETVHLGTDQRLIVEIT